MKNIGKRFLLPPLAGLVSAAVSVGACLAMAAGCGAIMTQNPPGWFASVYAWINAHSLALPLMMIASSFLMVSLLLLCETWFADRTAKGFRLLWWVGAAVAAGVLFALSMAVNGFAAVDLMTVFWITACDGIAVLLCIILLFLIERMARRIRKNKDYHMAKIAEWLLSLVILTLLMTVLLVIPIV